MAKRLRESESDDTMPAAADYHTVFIDTNLDTHFVTIVSKSETVFDFKKKIMLEHPQYFPKIGEIKIHDLKVKRKRHFYHLSESMLVRSAFEGAKNNWFLFADVSSLKQPSGNEHSCQAEVAHQSSLLHPVSTQCAKWEVSIANKSIPGDSCREASKDMEMEAIAMSGDHCKDLFSKEKRSDLEIQEKYNIVSEGNKLPGMAAMLKGDNSVDGISSVQCNNLLGQSLRAGTASKKKQKIKKQLNEDVVFEDPFKDEYGSIHASSKDISEPNIVGQVSNEVKMGNKDIGDELCKTSSLEGSERSESGLHRKDSLQERAAEVSRIQNGCHNETSKSRVGDVQGNNTFEEASQPKFSAKKKHKIKSKEACGDPLGKEEALISNSSKEISKPEIIIPNNSSGDDRKMINATSDSVVTKPSDGDHLETSPRRKKRTRKGRKDLSIPHNQVTDVVHPSAQAVGEEKSFEENVEINSAKLSDATTVPAERIQNERLSQPSGISQKKKQSEPVDEEIEGNKEHHILPGTEICEPDASNVEGKSDANEQVAGLGVKGTNPMKHRDNDAKEFLPLVVEEAHNTNKGINHSAQKTCVPDVQKFEIGQTEKIEEDRELSQNHVPEAMVSKRCQPLHQDESDLNIKQPVLSAKLSNANGIMGSGNSGGKGRIKKRAKKSAGRNQNPSGMESADNTAVENSSVAHCSAFDDHLSYENKKDESTLSHNERNEAAIQESVDTSPVNANWEGNNVRKNDAELPPLTQVDRTRENGVHMGEKSMKKVKKSQSSTMKSLPDLPIEELQNEEESLQLNQTGKTQQMSENVGRRSEKKMKKEQNSAAKTHSYLPIKKQEGGVGEPAASNDKRGKVDTPSETAKKTRSANASPKNPPTVSELEHATSIESGSLDPERPSGDVDIIHVSSSHALEGNYKERPEAKVDSDNQMEILKCETDRINFQHYFVPGQQLNEVGPADMVKEATRSERDIKTKKNSKKVVVPPVGSQQQNEIAPADKVKEATRSEREFKTKKNTKKLVLPPVGTPPSLRGSLKSNENLENEKKSHIRNTSSIPLQISLSKDKHNEVMLNPNKKLSKVAVSEAKAPNFLDNHGIRTPQEARQHHVQNGAETNRPALASPKWNCDSSAASSPSSRRSARSLPNKRDERHHVAARKISGKNNLEREKSLLTTPGSIFMDGSDESSADENGTVNSSASTCTPSNNSSSSGYSEGETQSSWDLRRNGSSKRNEDVGRNILKPQSSGPKNITMDMILRSSSRFKKAKLTASQSQMEDTENQPVDVVPDSQGIIL
ncbi:unnamed protein product [Ilex paraguariensis]|uniref:Uncharacterized protein n=1 Tax=Ilex paraguariensis TaxID=185542 RepID=A0ABC8TQ95_9AQUA